jgi:hypothetical protein
MGGVVMDECKDKFKKSCITKTNYKHSKGEYGILPSSDVYTCHGFFKGMSKFEKVDSKTIFHKFIRQFVNKRFSNPWELVINRFLETLKTSL